MITKEEAIEHLKNIKIYSFQDGYTDEAREALDMAIKALEAQKWIPCSERLPDSKEYVLVTDYGETNIGRRFCDRWWLDYCGDKMKDVTAWMPLPESYKAESEEV